MNNDTFPLLFICLLAFLIMLLTLPEEKEPAELPEMKVEPTTTITHR